MKYLLALCLILFSVNLAFANDITNHEKNHKHQNHHKQMVKKNEDCAIIGWLLVVDKNEIAAAKLANTKNIDRKAKNFANLMIKDHGQNLHATLKLSKETNLPPIDSKATIKSKEDGKLALRKLKKLNGKNFEVAYIDAMDKGHAKVLSQINIFIVEAKNPKLKHHLELTRVKVKEHLHKADVIEESLNQ